MSKKLGFIGAGNMANALIACFLESGKYNKSDIVIYDLDEEKSQIYKNEGYTVVSNEGQVFGASSFVFIAVSPFAMKKVLKNSAPYVTMDNVLISMAAGISIAFIKRNLGKDCKVVRIMPNTSVSVNLGTIAVSYEMPITYSELNEVKNLLALGGIVEILPEDKMNEVISVSGSAPIFVYELIKGMINGAISQGIDPEIAEHFTIQTILGATTMVANSNLDIDTHIKNMCTPNGTTSKIATFLDKHGFESIIGDAMLACTKRTAEIEREADRDIYAQ